MTDLTKFECPQCYRAAESGPETDICEHCKGEFCLDCLVPDGICSDCAEEIEDMKND